MEDNSKSVAISGQVISITVEELERRKERFRRATTEYYEHAEQGYRYLLGFCTESTFIQDCKDRSSNWALGKRKRQDKDTLPVRKSPLKRCRSRRRRTQISELEVDLALSLLESHVAIVELATKEYLFSIHNLVRLATSLIRPSQNGEGYVLRVPSSSPISVVVPLPVALNQPGETLQSRLQRHLSEAIEEQDVAMASVMQAVPESKITERLAKKVYNCADSIRVAVRKVATFTLANRNNNLYCCHYESFPLDTDPTIDTALRRKDEKNCSVWDRKVVEAQKLEGYYSWFRAHNGVLLVQKLNNTENNKGRNPLNVGCREGQVEFGMKKSS